MAQARLASRIAHRFNNSLAVIIANLEMAAEDMAAGRPLDPELVGLALTSARLATATCRALENFARPPGAPPSSVDLDAVLDDFRQRFPHVRCSAEHNGIWALAEESELLAALAALVIKGGPLIVERGSVSISVGEDQHVSISVEGDTLLSGPDGIDDHFSPLPDRDGRMCRFGLVWAMMRRAGGTMTINVADKTRPIVTLHLEIPSSGAEETNRS